jgi:hypothetical protein
MQYAYCDCVMMTSWGRCFPTLGPRATVYIPPICTLWSTNEARVGMPQPVFAEGVTTNFIVSVLHGTHYIGTVHLHTFRSRKMPCLHLNTWN